jgi:hypothetical protein
MVFPDPSGLLGEPLEPVRNSPKNHIRARPNSETDASLLSVATFLDVFRFTRYTRLFPKFARAFAADWVDDGQVHREAYGEEC